MPTTTAQDVFGKVQPQGPMADLTLSMILTWGLRLFFFGMGMVAFVYMLMGAFEWINSGGEPKKLETARGKITQAAIGMVISLLVLVGWLFFSTYILKIFKLENGQTSIEIPSIDQRAPTAVPTLP